VTGIHRKRAPVERYLSFNPALAEKRKRLASRLDPSENPQLLREEETPEPVIYGPGAENSNAGRKERSG